MQNENIKKIIIISTIILFIGILSYFIFFREKTSTTPDGDSENLFPVGEVGKVDLGKDFEALKDNPDYLSDQEIAQQIPILRKISDKPIVGAVIFKKDLKKDDFYTIRYIEKATGNIYETTTNSLTQERISNKTIPKINSAKWIDEDNLIFNYLDNDVIKTYSATLTPNASSTILVDLEGVYLQNDIQDLIYFDEDLFYLINSGTESRGILVDIDNTKPKQIFSSPLKEWLIHNINDKLISFTSKTTGNTLGYMFIFNSVTKNFSKMLDKKINLSTLPNENLDILYSENSNSKLQLSLYNFEEKTTIEIPLKTFPEKCVWSENNINIFCGVPTQVISSGSLNDWYKGNVLFSDNIWEIDTSIGKLKEIISIQDLVVEGIDIINLSVTSNNDYLIFMNKKDFSLWGLQLISD